MSGDDTCLKKGGNPELDISFLTDSCKKVELGFYLNPNYNVGTNIADIISSIAKEYEVNPSFYDIKYKDKVLGVVYHGDLETLDNSLEEYGYILCGNILLEKK